MRAGLERMVPHGASDAASNNHADQASKHSILDRRLLMQAAMCLREVRRSLWKIYILYICTLYILYYIYYICIQ